MAWENIVKGKETHFSTSVISHNAISPAQRNYQIHPLGRWNMKHSCLLLDSKSGITTLDSYISKLNLVYGCY